MAEEQNRRNLEKMNLSGGTTTTEYSSTTATQGIGMEGTASVSIPGPIVLNSNNKCETVQCLP